MNGRTCVVYHFFDDGASYRDNFLHFLTFGFLEEIDYYFIISGQTSLEMPRSENINYIYLSNENFDFGGVCRAINHINIEAYRFFIFLNSTVRGPFVPAHCKEPWFQIFIDLLTEEVGIAGLSINNLEPSSKYFQRYKVLFPENKRDYLAHVQTMAYILPYEILKLLIKRGFFDNSDLLQKSDVICRYEIHLSQMILDFGLNLSALLLKYQNLDFRVAQKSTPKVKSYQGDIWFPNMYRGFGIHPLQAVFVKTNRSLYGQEFLEEMSASCLGVGLQTSPLVQTSTDLAIYVGRLSNRMNATL